MTKLTKLPPPKTDVKQVLEETLLAADKFEGVIVLGILKEESAAFLRTSSLSAMEKTYLLAFFHAWVTACFNEEI